MSFTVMPYAELLLEASFGDLQDFRPGIRAIFRLHENEAGEWVWLTYIQDEMTFLTHHGEYYYVDRIDPVKGELECHDSNPTTGFFREKGILIETDGETRYWKKGQPARFSDIQIGDQIRTSTHGVGKGKVHMCWEVFLDDESAQKFPEHAESARGQAAPGRRLARLRGQGRRPGSQPHHVLGGNRPKQGTETWQKDSPRDCRRRSKAELSADFWDYRFREDGRPTLQDHPHA